jgi:hypothetical protein
MSTTITDLWPADIVTPRQTAPAAILRQQGFLLGQKTQNFVIGEVRSDGDESGTIFRHQFFVSAALLNVRVRLCLVTHGREFYPANLVAFEVVERNFGRERMEYIAADVNQFHDSLKAILAQDDVKSLIQSLTDQCRDLTDDSTG